METLQIAESRGIKCSPRAWGKALPDPFSSYILIQSSTGLASCISQIKTIET